ncbi:unnamed protein product [Moneuplotes crassus]|uniref:PX domain-containing protein n=1 Tax=Euplotes crassus TaxID=5936 RepID=A0AAD1U5U7_EUPCR|nr:unnamed protein product [Moneuplotes crassus]
MEQDTGDRHKKQDYLKREILDKNYDKAEFAEFMLKQKTDGLNVDNWDHKELIMAVDDFVRTHKQVPMEYVDPYNEEATPTKDRSDSSFGENQYMNTDEIDSDTYLNEGDQSNQSYDNYGQNEGYNPYDYPQDNYENSQGPQDYYNQDQKIEQTDPNAGFPEVSQEPAPQAVIPSTGNSTGTSDISGQPSDNKFKEIHQHQEQERERIRKEEEEESKKLEEEKKKEEKQAKKKERKAKKEERDEKEIQEKLQLESILTQAFNNETMFAPAKNFADMKPKHAMEYRIKKDKFDCVKLPKTKLNQEREITILVSQPEVIDEGFFLGKHLCFTVETRPLGWVVTRKDKDFNVLRDYLVKAFPHLVIPAVPEFHSCKSMDKSMTKKRENLLNRFMNKILVQKDLKASPVVLDFLSYEDSQAFTKQLKQSFDSAPKLRYVHEFPSVSGNHKVNITKKIEMMCNQYEKYVNSHECLFKKYHFLGRKLSSDLMEVAKTLDAISYCSKNLSTMYKMGNSSEMAEIYDNLSDHFKKWCKDMHHEAKINLRHIPQYFNYSSLEFEGYKDLLNKRNKIVEKFISKNNDLQVKKDKLFKAGKPEKWELSGEDMKRVTSLLNDKTEAFKVMLPEQTKQVDDYEKTYVFLSSQCYKEIRKFNKDEVDDLYEHFKEYTAKMGEILTTEQLDWASFDEKLHEREIGESEEDSKVDI